MKLKINIFLVLLVFFLSFIIYQNANNLSQYERIQAQMVCSNNDLANLWSERVKWNLYLHNKNIDFLYLRSNTKDSINVKKIVDIKPKLFLYIKDNTCSSCIDTSLYYLNKWSIEIGKENVYVLSSMKENEQLKLIMRFSDIDLPVYSTKAEIKLPEEFPPSTIFMIIDQRLHIRNALVADKYMGDIINYYLSCTNENVFNDNT